MRTLSQTSNVSTAELSPMEAGGNEQVPEVTIPLSMLSQIDFSQDDSPRDDAISLKYVQEGDEDERFEFSKFEATFVRLVECVRKYALEKQSMHSRESLWPWFRKLRSRYTLLLTHLFSFKVDGIPN